MEENPPAKPSLVMVLQWVYLVVFLISVAAIFVLHSAPDFFLEFLRVPKFLREIDPFLGYAWPATLYVYQAVLVIFLFIIFINSLGLLFYNYRTWRIISDLTSFFGLFVIWTAGVFFVIALSLGMFTTAENVKTALTFFLVAIFLFILDLITFFVDEQHLGRKFLKFSQK